MITHADFKIERRYRVPVEQAFRAFSDPDLKQRWFANPGGWDDAVWELDFRVGGGEVNAGGGPGAWHEFRSRFHDIVENERIVFAYDLLHDHRLISVSLASFEFFAAGGGTSLVLTEHGAFFDPPPAPREREQGTGKLLDRLGLVLEGDADRQG